MRPTGRMCARAAPLAAVAVLACAAGFRFAEQGPTPAACAAPAWCVRGVVVSATDGRPVFGAHVVVAATACGAAADSTGAFTLTCSGAPGAELVVRGLGFTTLRRRVTIVPGRQYVARIPLEPLPTSIPVF